jgi:hypothetical protein
MTVPHAPHSASKLPRPGLVSTKSAILSAGGWGARHRKQYSVPGRQGRFLDWF